MAARRHIHNDVYQDLTKIKALLADTAYDVKDNAVDLLADSVYTAKKKSTRLRRGLEKYTHRHPLKTVGICFLTGLMLGLIKKR